MIVCERCGNLAGFNSFFNGYYCSSCGELYARTKRDTENSFLVQMFYMMIERGLITAESVGRYKDVVEVKITNTVFTEPEFRMDVTRSAWDDSPSLAAASLLAQLLLKRRIHLNAPKEDFNA